MSAASTKSMPGYTWKHMPLFSAVSYSVISIAITLINKVVLTSYGALRLGGGVSAGAPRGLCSLQRRPPPLPTQTPTTPAAFQSAMTLTLLQGLLTVVCLELMRRYGYIEYDPWSWNLLKKVRPPPPPPRAHHPAAAPPPNTHTRASPSPPFNSPLPPLLPFPLFL